MEKILKERNPFADKLKKVRKDAGLRQEDFADKIGIKRTTYATYENFVTPDKYVLEKVSEVFSIPLEYWNIAQVEYQNSNNSNVIKQSKRTRVTGDEIRGKKAFEETDDPGLYYVPISTQANYTKHFSEPVFINQLKRWKIPDFPYKGDRYRIFQIEGDSMSYINKEGQVDGLQDNMEIVAERVDPENWNNTVQWYVHVIVFEDLLTIKRLWRDEQDDNESFVLIADNPNYPQKRVKRKDIKELWIMKRYLGWSAPPPRRYEIAV